MAPDCEEAFEHVHNSVVRYCGGLQGGAQTLIRLGCTQLCGGLQEGIWLREQLGHCRRCQVSQQWQL